MKDFSETSGKRGKYIHFKLPIVPCISERIYQCPTLEQGTWWSAWRAGAQVRRPTLSQKLQGGSRAIRKDSKTIWRKGGYSTKINLPFISSYLDYNGGWKPVWVDLRKAADLQLYNSQEYNKIRLQVLWARKEEVFSLSFITSI